eukprot:g40298.t1
MDFEKQVKPAWLLYVESIDVDDVPDVPDVPEEEETPEPPMPKGSSKKKPGKPKSKKPAVDADEVDMSLEGFRQPELDLSQRHHRQLLALYRGKAKVSGLRRVSANNSTAQELLQGLCIDELTVRGRNLVGLLRAPAAVRSLRLVDNKRENVLPAALAALRAPHALLQLETSFFVNEAKTRAVLAKCQSLQSFSVLSSQSHFGPDDDQEEKVLASEEKSKTWQKLNGRPFQCLEGLADLRRLEVRYRFMGTFDWLSQLETLPLVEELKLDPVRVWHLEILARLTNVATKLKKLELGWKSDITQTGLNCLAKFRSLCHLDLCGDILEMDEEIDFRSLSTLPLQHLGISFRGDEDTKCLRDLLRCASLSKVLRRLSIDDCKLTDEDLAGLPAGLHSLALSDCAISEHGLAGLPAHEVFCSCSVFVYIDVCNCCLFSSQARCSLPPLSTRVVPTRDPSKLQPSLVWLRAFGADETIAPFFRLLREVPAAEPGLATLRAHFQLVWLHDACTRTLSALHLYCGLGRLAVTNAHVGRVSFSVTLVLCS